MTKKKKGKESEPEPEAVETVEAPSEDILEFDKTAKDDKPGISLSFKTTKADMTAFLDIIGAVSDEFTMNVSKSGMKIHRVDPAHVCMVRLDIPKDYFEDWKYKADKGFIDGVAVTGDTEYRIGVELSKLKEFLKSFGRSDEVEFSYDSHTHKMLFKVGRVKRRIAELDTTGLMDPKLPDLNLKTTIKLKNSHLSEAIRAVGQVSDHIRITASKNGMIAKGEGNTDDVEIPYGKIDGVEVSGDSCVSLFPLDYLNSFTNCISDSTELEIQTGSDYPMKVEFSISRNGTKFECVYMLAPRIEAD